MMSLSQAATAINGMLQGDDAVFSAVSKDTRSLHLGDLYVALKGENFDGHVFLKTAADLGAVGALVSDPKSVALSQICVDDTRIALGDLAAAWRGQFKGKLVAVTGSNGKTTVKEMCRAILLEAVSGDRVLSTQGNLNNDIGMPMTLLSIRQQHDYAVIEMGANHVGEINYLTRIAKPDIAVITNAGPAHLEGFGSIEKVAQAKSEIYGGLTDGGVAIINLDDDYADYWQQVCQGKNIVTFSMKDKQADVYAEVQADAGYRFKTTAGDVSIVMNVPGRHNVMNALASTAVALTLGVSLENIASALQSFSNVSGRLNIQQGLNDARVIDDTYNANPISLNAAIDVLIEMGGKSCLVLGDMAELGDSAAALHFEAGQQAKKLGVKKLFAMGELSRNAVKGFGKGAEFYEDRNALIKAVTENMNASTTILVKGSRSMAMEKVVNALLLDDSSNKQRLI
ncbi:MAG: UDP-N-acetylmuramoyl-tripeptide--D-alanyl-D-alanine ligase [Gammaproteobacteria bacterium]|nr:UDP-N-acetylmuramoyl-tripeptide--D-alanyl-D-alanine ligase [Gammaproteobacteria bacterium]